jgi:flagellin
VINGESIAIVGQGLQSIAINDTPDASGTGTVAFDAATGVLTITGNFTGNGTPPQVTADASATVIQTAIAALDGFTATGAAAAGTAALPTAATVTANQTGLTIAATTLGSDFNNVAINFVSGAADAADYDSEQKVLTVTLEAGQVRTGAQMATLINGATLDGEAAANPLFATTALAAAEFDTDTVIASAGTGVSGGEVLQQDLVFQLNGADGAETFNFAAGSSKDQIAAAINLVGDSTGVTAETNTDGDLQFTSSAYGSDALINVDVISEGAGGTFEASLSESRAVGQDVQATVNGVEADGKANTLSINTASLAMSITIENGSNTNFSFTITGGGALFQLGPDVTSNQQARLGIGSVSTGKLGGASGRLFELGSGQAKSLVNDVSGAARIVDEVIDKVTSLRGRLGAFQATSLESNLVSLNDTVANLQEAESSIRDADFAAESAALTRAQILVQSGTNVLSLANQNPQNVLSLLR